MTDRSFLSPLASFPILLLDDELDRMEPLLIALRKRGFTIDGVVSPTEARARLAQGNIAILVTDHRMPEMSGVDFLIEVATQYPHIVRILFTGYGDHETAMRAINQGNLFRYIIKSEPIAQIAAILKEAVRYCADAHRRQTELAALRVRDKAEAVLTVLRDVRYDWGNIVLTQQLQFRKMEALLAATENKYSLDLTPLKEKCLSANREIEASLKEYFENPFLDSTLTEEEAFTSESLIVPLQLAFQKVKSRSDPERIHLHLDCDKTATFSATIQRERLKAAIGLILQNAVESIADRGEITVSLRRERIDNTDFGLITITDTGKGIAPDLQRHIFDPMCKSPDKQGHMGIGLTFAKAIIEEHQGTIAFTSEIGKGSTFTVRIPLTADSKSTGPSR